MSRRLVALLLLITSIASHTCAVADDAPPPPLVFESESFAYRITLPDAWVRIPRTSLAMMTKNTLKQQAAGTVVFDAGFQSSADAPWFTHPYALIQIMSYDNLGSPEQPMDRDLDDVVSALTGVDIDKEFSRAARDEVREAVLNVSRAQNVHFDRTRRRFAFEFELTVADVGVIHARSTGIFGRNVLALMHFYAPKETWTTHEPTAQLLADAFAFNPDSAYDETRASSTPLSALRRFAPGPSAGGVLLAIVALVMLRKRRRRERLSPGA